MRATRRQQILLGADRRRRAVMPTMSSVCSFGFGSLEMQQMRMPTRMAYNAEVASLGPGWYDRCLKWTRST